MDKLFSYQAKLMKILGVPDSGRPDFLNDKYFQLAVMGLVSEAGEVLNEMSIATKPWKHKPQDQNEADTIEEITDVFFFVMEALILAGITADDLEDSYIEKCRKNLRRIETKGNPDVYTLSLIGDLRNDLDRHNVITNIEVSESQDGHLNDLRHVSFFEVEHSETDSLAYIPIEKDDEVSGHE